MSKTLLYGATKIDRSNSAYAPIESLAAFQWKNRVFILFADKDNARAARQENQLLSDRSALDQRDMVVLKVSAGAVRALFGAADDLDGEAIRRDLEAPEAGEFAAFLLGKDGTVKLKVSEPITSGELFAIIDSMPMRAAETLRPDR
ncbi:DUF4174 domain-containing protein [Rhizobium bangladeshense]|uniref:DUF4174 domain-containing protein n=1 Tax=Rhizobium bangladeshense TaxID=1138189 RepID=A0ABS7LDI5_9HYPH|nr:MULTISPECIES: DUF4174 domain-containing protein [Rhizobium]MBX4865640.1 DUF4174 domain-containing protein [Rhizobium bangladeshense]MBX4875484.1 DUF4174 domain-containing protein [Rhizobium bangladeshense]MBX4882222.1 DUF4174 domain-containing protein [Rhizobium bangladeshense]MBY3589532.1 DUF4174 domain-containing protein [Rhizobium bangladeshense]MBY3600092.1 DUF4174 domain-containing protein [Rhizobium bangladeshense]